MRHIEKYLIVKYVIKKYSYGLEHDTVDPEEHSPAQFYHALLAKGKKGTFQIMQTDYNKRSLKFIKYLKLMTIKASLLWQETKFQ